MEVTSSSLVPPTRAQTPFFFNLAQRWFPVPDGTLLGGTADAGRVMEPQRALMALSGTSIRRTALEKQGHWLEALFVRILEKTTREPTGERVRE